MENRTEWRERVREGEKKDNDFMIYDLMMYSRRETNPTQPLGAVMPMPTPMTAAAANSYNNHAFSGASMKTNAAATGTSQATSNNLDCSLLQPSDSAAGAVGEITRNSSDCGSPLMMTIQK